MRVEADWEEARIRAKTIFTVWPVTLQTCKLLDKRTLAPFVSGPVSQLTDEVVLAQTPPPCYCHAKESAQLADRNIK